MKGYWGVEVEPHAFLTSSLDGGEWSASRSDRFTPRERALGIHRIGGWVGPRYETIPTEEKGSVNGTNLVQKGRNIITFPCNVMNDEK
jgi:hypothetical protein